MAGILHQLIFDYTLRTVVLGSATVGLIAGSLGSFAVLKRQSLLGDAISHAALPGIAIAFLLTLSKSPIIILSGAILAGWIGTLLVMLFTQVTKTKEDAALGIILSVFFGLGIFLLTIIQKLPTSNKAGIETFLFGNAATLLQSDVVIMAVLGLVVIVILFLLWKNFKILVFDYAFAKSLGLPVQTMNILLITLIVFAIALGLQTVGVVLMSAMIIAPAAAARQWTDKLSLMVIIAALFGAISGVTGAVISSLVDNLPTGPTIVLIISSIVAISLILAPNRGIFWDFLRAKKNRKEVRITNTLLNLFRLSQSHSNSYHPHDIKTLLAIDPTGVREAITELENKGFVRNVINDKLALTQKGLKRAKSLAKGGGAL
jgi:manganese/zinc/iron transport system permease protein|tara:strand:- start:3417 stop:4538 length:1122 start_codon:yes stop_codon:yes gene_type:complete